MSLAAHQDKMIAFLETTVIFLLITNAVSIACALAAVMLHRNERVRA